MANLMTRDKGFKRLLRGTNEIGTCLVTDRGYVVRLNVPDIDGEVPPSAIEVCSDLNSEMIWRVLHGRKVGHISFLSNDLLLV